MNKVLAVIIILIIIIIGSFVGIIFSKNFFASTSTSLPQAFVGVTYGGNSVTQAKMLIDKVKGYTNLFVLQSGFLQRDLNSVNEIGDYAVSAGMYFLPYFGAYVPATMSTWIHVAEQKWGSHFLGIYYSDEPGGKMLDDYVYFNDSSTGDEITKTIYGDVVDQKTNGIIIQYEMNGVINLYQPNIANSSSDIDNEATFYPNGTIQIIKADNGIADFSYSNYEQLLSLRPFKDLNDTAQRFINRDKANIEYLKINSNKVFTSDYALYWFDYLSGYDVVLGQIGWNLTFSEQIAMLRGAATVQNKDWGVVITWKYDHPPYLDNASVILDQMTSAYLCGAKYFLLYNYYASDENPYGTLTSEDFQALKSFWLNVVNNHEVIQGTTKADAVLVLPQNYGWGARWSADHIWGIFEADNETSQYWNLMQTVLQEHGLKLDIVYADKEFELPATYQNIYRT